MSVFQLAENLHMTVGRLRKEMTVAEYINWLRFYAQKNEESEEPKVENTKEDVMRAWG